VQLRQSFLKPLHEVRGGDSFVLSGGERREASDAEINSENFAFWSDRIDLLCCENGNVPLPAGVSYRGLADGAFQGTTLPVPDLTEFGERDPGTLFVDTDGFLVRKGNRIVFSLFVENWVVRFFFEEADISRG